MFWNLGGELIKSLKLLLFCPLKMSNILKEFSYYYICFSLFSTPFSLYLSIFLPFLSRYVYIYLNLSIFLSIYWSIYPFIYIYLSIYLSIHQAIQTLKMTNGHRRNLPSNRAPSLSMYIKEDLCILHAN